MRIVAEPLEITLTRDLDERVILMNCPDRLTKERWVRLIEAAPELLATLEQIARLSREADRSRVDVASMLGDIARAAIAKAAGI